MINEIKLTLEELFFLGVTVEAKQIDYAYFSAMPDISKDYGLKQKKCIASLVSKGFLEEDFSGECVPIRDVEDLLKPLFFMEKEIVVSEVDSFKNIYSTRYYFLDGNIIRAELQDKELYVVRIDSSKFTTQMERTFHNEKVPEKEIIPASEVENGDLLVIDVVVSEGGNRRYEMLIKDESLFVPVNESSLKFCTKESMLKYLNDLLEV